MNALVYGWNLPNHGYVNFPENSATIRNACVNSGISPFMGMLLTRKILQFRNLPRILGELPDCTGWNNFRLIDSLVLRHPIICREFNGRSCYSVLYTWYTYNKSGFKTYGLQNVSFTKRQVYKMSGLQNVRSSKRPVAKKHPYIYILYLWLVEIRRFCCSHLCRQSDGCVLFSILDGFLPYITIIASNK